MVPSNLAWVIPWKHPSDHANLLNPFTGSFSPIIAVAAPKYLKKNGISMSRSPISRADFLWDTQGRDKLWSILNSYSTAVKQPLHLPLSQDIVRYNKPIGPKPHLRTSDPQTRVQTPLMTTGKVLSEWIWWTLHPYFLSLTSCSFRWSNTSCDFILPCLYPHYSSRLECPSLPCLLDKLLFIL